MREYLLNVDQCWAWCQLIPQTFSGFSALTESSILHLVGEDNGGCNDRTADHATFKGHVFEECLMVGENMHEVFINLKSRLWNTVYTIDPNCILK